MFDRYTEKARRTIFFARYECSQFGSPHIETEHLLLGLLREEPALARRFMHPPASAESIRSAIEAQAKKRDPVSTSVDLPLSNECKRVLAYAAEESMRLHHQHIGCEHLFLGLLREENCVAALLLKERGVGLIAVREQLAREPRLQVKTETAADLPAQFAHLPSSMGGSPSLELFAEDGSVLAEVPWKRSQLPRIGDAIQIVRDGQDKRYRVVDLTWKVTKTENPATQVVSVVVTVRPEDSPPTAA